MNKFAGLELLASAVLVMDPQGCIVYANPAAENLLERPFKLLYKLQLKDLFLNDDELLNGFEQAVAQQSKGGVNFFILPVFKVFNFTHRNVIIRY